MSTLIRRAILALALIAGIAPALAQAPPPIPALPDTERRTSYSISASTCACAVGFQLYGDSTDYANWIEVFVNGALIPQAGNWTIASPSGSLATLPRPITNAVLTFTVAQTGTVQIVGARRPRRTTQFGQNVAARDLNQAITDIVAMLRESWDKTNDVTGRAVLAPPGETLALLPVKASRINQGACFDNNGYLTSCVAVASSTFIAGNGILFTGTNPTTITNNIVAGPNVTITGTNPLSINVPLLAGPGIVLSGANPLVISAGSVTNSVVLVPSRAAAIATDLHTYGAIQTLGYATAGDGGGATFKNIGSAPFQDSGIATGSISAAGSGYTNGTYLGIVLTGGTGTDAIANIVVSAGVVNSVTIISTHGNGYTVGDVLTTSNANIGGTGSGFTYTVATLTTPTGSFTDSVGTHFQIVVDQGNYLNTKQFGAKVDWTVALGDAGSTNDTTAIQNAMNFAAAIVSPTIDAGGTHGTTLIQPVGNSLACALQIPDGVKFIGQNAWSSQLKQCDALGVAAHFITICDSTTHLACFGSQIKDMTLFPGSGAANSNVAMIYSNNIQQMNAVERVFIFSGPRVCIYLDTGFGGAASVGLYNIECHPRNTSINPGIIPSYTAAVLTIRDSVVESNGATLNGIQITQGGIVVIDGLHSEGITVPIFVNVTGGGTTIVNVHNVTGGNTCTGLVTRQAGSVTNQINAGMLQPNGCTNTINNAGAVTTGLVVSDVKF